MSVALLVAWFSALAAAAAMTGNSSFLLLLGVAVWVAAEKNTETLLMLSLADGKTKDMLLSLGLRRILTALLLGACVSLGLPVLLAYSTALAISGLLGASWTWRQVADSLPRAGSEPMRPLLKAALPFWLNSLAIHARNLDVVLVGLSATPAVAGVYAAPSRLSGPLGLLPSSLAQVLLPTAARGEPGKSRQTWTAMLAMTGCTTVLFGALALLAGQLLPLLLGHEYNAAVQPLRILLIGLVFFGISASLISILQGSGDEKYVAGANLTVAALSLPAVYVAASTAGASGAAAAMTAGYIIQAGLLGGRAHAVAVRRRRSFSLPSPTIGDRGQEIWSEAC